MGQYWPFFPHITNEKLQTRSISIPCCLLRVHILTVISVGFLLLGQIPPSIFFGEWWYSVDNKHITRVATLFKNEGFCSLHFLYIHPTFTLHFATFSRCFTTFSLHSLYVFSNHITRVATPFKKEVFCPLHFLYAHSTCALHFATFVSTFRLVFSRFTLRFLQPLRLFLKKRSLYVCSGFRYIFSTFHYVFTTSALHFLYVSLHFL